MPKVVKSISLDERTAPIAQSKDNFSAWVREQLLLEIAHTIPCHFFKVNILDRNSKTTETKEEVCNGMRKPPCPNCYPNGPPIQEDWKAYATGRIDLEELHRRTDIEWKWRIDLRNQAKTRSENTLNDAPTPHLRERKYVRRLIWWLWSWI